MQKQGKIVPVILCGGSGTRLWPASRHDMPKQFLKLTGDDKSSLYWLLSEGYEQLYVPDVRVVSLESPPGGPFIIASTKLMFRWFGNMMRTNGQVLRLGPMRMPFFVWWCFLDQRVSTWTTLTGPVFALMLAGQQGAIALLYYFAWLGFTRWFTALTLLTARPSLDWRYVFLLLYNQFYGSLIKTWLLFRLDRQSWTRQNTKMRRENGAFKNFLRDTSSVWLHAAALVALISAVGLASGYMSYPDAAIHRFLF